MPIAAQRDIQVQAADRGADLGTAFPTVFTDGPEPRREARGPAFVDRPP